MKAKSIGYLAAIIISTTLAANAGLAPNASEVVKLAKSGASEDVAAAYVRSVSGPFHLSSDDILALKAQGVSSQVIVAMLTHDAQIQGQAQIHRPPPQVQPPPADVPVQPAPAYDQPPATTYYPQEVIPASPGPDYYWSPGYSGDNGIWIGGGWCYGGVGLGWGWPLGYGWGGYGRGYYGGYGRGYYGGYGRGYYGGYGRGSYGGYRGGVGGYRGAIGGGHAGGIGGGACRRVRRGSRRWRGGPWRWRRTPIKEPVQDPERLDGRRAASSKLTANVEGTADTRVASAGVVCPCSTGGPSASTGGL